jgi:hypothetical protein
MRQVMMPQALQLIYFLMQCHHGAARCYFLSAAIVVLRR